MLYKDYCPTGFDHHISLDHEEETREEWGEGRTSVSREDWLVAGYQDRDSGLLTLSNFSATLESLGGESEEVEVHRFGHWGCGWFELILAHPSKTKDVEEKEIEASLEEHSVLDESDLSERECEQEWEDWKNWGERDFLKELQDWFVLQDSTVNWFEEKDRAWQLYQDKTSGTEHTSEGTDFNWGFLGGCRFSREKLATWIWKIRAEEKNHE